VKVYSGLSSKSKVKAIFEAKEFEVWIRRSKPKKSPKQSPISESAKRKFRSRRSWVRRLNLDRQDDLKQLNFRRSINRNSLEGIEVAKLFYKTSLKSSKYSSVERKEPLRESCMVCVPFILYLQFTINASLFLLQFFILCHYFRLELLNRGDSNQQTLSFN
jgi:hypothetical protein